MTAPGHLPPEYAPVLDELGPRRRTSGGGGGSGRVPDALASSLNSMGSPRGSSGGSGRGSSKLEPAHLCPLPQDRPAFHVAPRCGWINDPNGPFQHNGRFHMFYQHLVAGCEWGWGLVWGHAVSADLVHWEHAPVALEPTAGFQDADGCFSGCACLDVDGTPTILYTGVRLRGNADAGPMPPPHLDLQLPFIEVQLFATPTDPSDPHLKVWEKCKEPMIPLPPEDVVLTGWRDPFIVERPDGEGKGRWRMLIGSGIKSHGGVALVYISSDLKSGWEYEGFLCSGDGDTGLVWECPIVCKLPVRSRQKTETHLHNLRGAHFRQSMQHIPLDAISEDSSSAQNTNKASSGKASSHHHRNDVYQPPVDERYTHFFSISPDACQYATIYWLGRYSEGRFAIQESKGPLRLDLGDILYAPNLLQDDKGRWLLFGWLQERRSVGTYDYAGCLSVPRLLSLDYDRLFQEPVPEIKSLRTAASWRDMDIHLEADQPLPLPDMRGTFLDLELVFQQGTSSTVGLLLKSANASGEGGAAILFSWETCILEVVYEALDPFTMTFSLGAPTARHTGGTIEHRAGDQLELRILIDYSCVEIYTGTGEVLSTRIYRGITPGAADSGIEFVAFGGDAVLVRAEAYEMASIWKEDIARAREQGPVMPEFEAKLSQLTLTPKTSLKLPLELPMPLAEVPEENESDLFLDVLV